MTASSRTSASGTPISQWRSVRSPTSGGPALARDRAAVEQADQDADGARHHRLGVGALGRARLGEGALHEYAHHLRGGWAEQIGNSEAAEDVEESERERDHERAPDLRQDDGGQHPERPGADVPRRLERRVRHLGEAGGEHEDGERQALADQADDHAPGVEIGCCVARDPDQAEQRREQPVGPEKADQRVGDDDARHEQGEQGQRLHPGTQGAGQEAEEEGDRAAGEEQEPDARQRDPEREQEVGAAHRVGEEGRVVGEAPAGDAAHVLDLERAEDCQHGRQEDQERHQQEGGCHQGEAERPRALLPVSRRAHFARSTPVATWPYQPSYITVCQSLLGKVGSEAATTSANLAWRSAGMFFQSSPGKPPMSFTTEAWISGESTNSASLSAASWCAALLGMLEKVKPPANGRSVSWASLTVSGRAPSRIACRAWSDQAEIIDTVPLARSCRVGLLPAG